MSTSHEAPRTRTPAEAETGSARIPLEHPRILLVRAICAWSRREYGQVLEPGLAMLHNRRGLVSVVRFERMVERWSSLDTSVKDLACAAVSAQVGCSWCVDFGGYIARRRGMTEERPAHLGNGRSSAVFNPFERHVPEYAEAMTSTPPEVTDEMVANLRVDLSDAQLVELTELISLENLRSRTNSALGLRSQGLRDHCEVASP